MQVGKVWLALPLVLLAASCSSGPSVADDSSYVKEIADARTAKDQAFRQEPEPIPPAKRDIFLPLRYYAPDPDYNVPAVLHVSDERPVFEMPTSTGAIRKMQLVGSLEFTFAGESHTLGAFVPDGTQQIASLFVPFADATTGTETYSAGRYLDIHPTATGIYTIDFNTAYNPYCAYNQTYECPYPPPANRLKVPVRAGEKSPGA